MSLIQIRKRSLTIETTYHEGGPVSEHPLKLAASCAVIQNPYAGRYEPDLMPFMALAAAAARRSIAAAGIEAGTFRPYHWLISKPL